MTEHRITRDTPTHRRWDVDVPPVVFAQPGDTVVAETDDHGVVGTATLQPLGASGVRGRPFPLKFPRLDPDGDGP